MTGERSIRTTIRDGTASPVNGSGPKRIWPTGNVLTASVPSSEISEKNYFFKMSKYQSWLIEHIEKNDRFILPSSTEKRDPGLSPYPSGGPLYLQTEEEARLGH